MSALVLASASTARATMLRAAGVRIEVDPARIDEQAIKQAMHAEAAPPRDIADKLAELKAMRISARHPGRLVLGADQMLGQGGRMFDKPRDEAEARAHLSELRGKTHHLISAGVIVRDARPLWRHVGTARLTMRPFSDAFLDQYIAGMGADLLDSVGCYKLEGTGAQLFSAVEGDYFTVLGLPLIALLGFLRAQEVLIE